MKKVIKSYIYDTTGNWHELDSKKILDFDGYPTDYTLYENEYGTSWLTMFGDKNLYYPDEEDADELFDSRKEAYRFFRNFELTDEDRVYSNRKIKRVQEK